MTDHTQADRIIAKFGGRPKTVAATGLSYEKVRHAERVGYFNPDKYQIIINAGAAAGIEITPYDFIAHLVPARLRATESVG